MSNYSVKRSVILRTIIILNFSSTEHKVLLHPRILSPESKLLRKFYAQSESGVKRVLCVHFAHL